MSAKLTEPQIWYEVTGYGAHIEKVNVVAFTAHTVTVRQPSLWKDGGYICQRRSRALFFPTFDEAKDFLVNREEAALQSARIRLQKAQGSLGNAKGITEKLLKEPE